MHSECDSVRTVEDGAVFIKKMVENPQPPPHPLPLQGLRDSRQRPYGLDVILLVHPNVSTMLLSLYH